MKCRWLPQVLISKATATIARNLAIWHEIAKRQYPMQETMKESRLTLFDHADIAEDSIWTENVGIYPRMPTDVQRTGKRR
jgi:hypothetical protein